MRTRREQDILGSCDVPLEAYWGIHTFRAQRNFPLSGYPVSRALIRALSLVKKACCEANEELGYLETSIGQAIRKACDEIAHGVWDKEFPLDALQGGAGTSTNMNINEVIANRALELLGHAKGDYRYCHPLEHVNLHQSTNDVYPTAVKIAAIGGVRELSTALATLQGALQCKEKAFSSVVMIGRTELQDAVPITLGAQFASFADALARDRWRTFKCEERLRTINLGGTAVGTGLAAPRRYIFLVAEKIRQLTGYGLTRGENVMDQTANVDAFVEVSGILGAHAANIVKLCSDLRHLHTLGEITLPPVQAGSSIMPGKINPVICEAGISAGIKVAANGGIITDCAGRGSLQINEFIPLIADALLESIHLLTNVDIMLKTHIDGIQGNAATCEQYLKKSQTLITAFLPYIGYQRAQALVQQYNAGGGTDFQAFLEDELGGELVKKVLSPASLMSLGFKEHSTQQGKQEQ